MQTLTPTEQQQLELELELEAGESIVWSGKPNPKVIFHRSDFYLVPLSLLWGGFAIFWEFGVTGHFDAHASSGGVDWFFALWGMPFVIAGQYFIWGRFFYARWLKNRVLYAATQTRVFTVVLAPRRRVISSFLNGIPSIEKDVRADGNGTLSFGVPPASRGRNSRAGSLDGLQLGAGYPVFVDIDDADAVYRIVSDLRRKLV